MTKNKFVIEVTAENFQDAVVENSHKVAVLLDFWAPWCQPCKTLIPTLHKIADDFNGSLILAKINTEENPELGEHFQIRSIPTVMLVKDGAVIDKFNGALPESGILEFLKKHGIVNELEAILEEAKTLSASGDFEQLVEILSGALEQYEQNTNIKLELAKGLIRLKRTEDAKEVLDSIAQTDKQKSNFKAIYASLSFEGEQLSQEDIQKLESKGDIDSNYKLGVFYLADGQYENGLEFLLKVIGTDKNYKDGDAKTKFLDTLSVLGDSNPLTRVFRRKLFTFLY